MTIADIRAAESRTNRVFFFEGKPRTLGEISLLVHNAGIKIPRAQLKNRVARYGFDTLEKMRKPLAPDTQGHRPAAPRLIPAPVVVKHSCNAVVECAECGHDSPLMFWRIGNHERYRCTQCQTIFEVEMK